MKKQMSLFLCFLLIFSLSACGSQKEEPKEIHTIAMICESSVDDGGWGESCYNAMLTAAEKLGWETLYKDSVPSAENAAVISAFCEQGIDMVYATGGEYNDIVLEMAEKYPDTAFALLNGSEQASMFATNSNVVSVVPSAEQIGWMAGTLAALQSQTGVVAFIGGTKLQSTQLKYRAFCEATEYVAAQEGKTVKVLDCTYAGTFDDSVKGENLAAALMYKNADVFFGDASAVDSGVRTAIDAHNKAAGRIEVFDIGQPSDLLGQNDCVIYSVVTDNAAMLLNVMQSFEAGTFGGSTQHGSIQNSTLSSGAFSALVSSEIQAKYNAYFQQMLEMAFLNDIAS